MNEQPHPPRFLPEQGGRAKAQPGSKPHQVCNGEESRFFGQHIFLLSRRHSRLHYSLSILHLTFLSLPLIFERWIYLVVSPLFLPWPLLNVCLAGKQASPGGKFASG